MTDIKDDRSDSSGSETVVESVIALYMNLIDYGEATTKSDVEDWKDNVMSNESILILSCRIGNCLSSSFRH